MPNEIGESDGRTELGHFAHGNRFSVGLGRKRGAKSRYRREIFHEAISDDDQRRIVQNIVRIASGAPVWQVQQVPNEEGRGWHPEVVEIPGAPSEQIAAARVVLEYLMGKPVQGIAHTDEDGDANEDDKARFIVDALTALGWQDKIPPGLRGLVTGDTELPRS